MRRAHVAEVALASAIALVVSAGCGDKPSKATPPDAPEMLPQEETDPTARPWIGVIVPTDAQDVLAPYASTVTTMPVSVGQRVEVGDVVATLDPRPIQEELATARAALAQAQASLRQARISAESSTAEVAWAKAAFEGKYGAENAIEKAESNEKLAAAAVSQNEASVAQQQVAVQMLQGRAARTQVRATIGGEVSKKYAEIGSKVEKEVPLLRIIGKRSLLLRFAVPLAESGKIVPGYKLTLSCLIADTSVVASAEVAHMSPEADPVAQMVLGEATLMDVVGSTYTPGTVCRITR